MKKVRVEVTQSEEGYMILLGDCGMIAPNVQDMCRDLCEELLERFQTNMRLVSLQFAPATKVLDTTANP